MVKERDIQIIATNFIDEKNDRNFKFLYERLRPGILNHCYGILKDKDLSEDAFTNCMTKIWLKNEQYNIDRGNFSTWCYNIAKNESLLIIKDRKKYKNKTEGDVEYLSAVNNLKNIPDEHMDPLWAFIDDEITIDDIYDDIIEEIKNLPPLYKDIMIDREINKMKYKDIAEKYGLKKRSVATRIRRARNKIKKKMESNIKPSI